jgi:hypothetical protein
VPKDKKEVLGRTNHLLSYGMDGIENGAAFNSSSIFVCVLIAAVTLPSRCLATVGGLRIGTQSDWEGFMKYAVEMG